MEHKRCEESRQSTLGFKCKKIVPGEEKLSMSAPNVIQGTEIGEKQDMGLASPTPEKRIQPPRNKKKGVALPTRAVKQTSEDFITQSEVQNPVNSYNKDVSNSEFSESSSHVVKKLLRFEARELPYKYKIIAEFFDRMECSIRLLSLRKKLSTFQNICIQVEILMKRKFLYKHLAQIKYIFPEAVQIEKILTHDEGTLCVKPDMKISLLSVVLVGHPDQSTSMALRGGFLSRLLDFANMHPEDGDIPEALLPEPFNQQNCTIMAEQLPIGSSTKSSEPTIVESESLLSFSHLSPSFCSRFSQKVAVPETEKTQLLASPATLLFASSDNEGRQDIKCPPTKETVSSVTTNISSPAKLIFSPYFCTDSHFSGTPLKPVSTPGKLIIETPGQPTQKRSMPSPNDCTSIETEISNNSTRRRALIFSSTMETDASTSNLIVGTAKQNRVTCNSGLQSVTTKEISVEEDIIGSASHLETVQENASYIFEDRKTSLTGLEKRRQMITSLPGLFNIIQLIFKSANCSSITKQELLHKILLHNCDIVESREVEEQLELLEELVPDWICGKMMSSGDFLYCIKRISNPESMLARLVESV
ncbi:CDT1-like protein a, chloroplastic [Tasmannia lanceolata]|uniref:CDT1-like protein a, chloroplastic n=1 Tax=Tasmannia lanceolata TaxID=3420 RepID=UPI00406406FF